MALSRRVVITGIPVAVASVAVLGVDGCTSSPSPPSSPGSSGSSGSGGPVQALRFFTSHQFAVVSDATARIAPGPADDPAEAGHPGAREAGVVYYIDGMLGAQATFETGGEAAVPAVFAGGPWSDRHASGRDYMASFIALDPVSNIAWTRRLVDWQVRYIKGITNLDKLAGGDFTAVSPAAQDKILAKSAVSSFLALLFEHTIEGLYSVPEYGGNRGLAGWKDISYPGDSQPAGYTADEVSRSDGRDAVADTGVVADVLKFLGAL